MIAAETNRAIAVVAFPAGGYSFLPAVPQYSGGVAASAGFAIRRIRFAAPVPLQEGFRRIGQILNAAGRPLTSLCACELRAKRQFTEPEFKQFNDAYLMVLKQWGLEEQGMNPVARSCVCPDFDAPDSPSFHAFSYTVALETAAPAFVIAGSGEAPEGKANYRDHIIRVDELSADAMREKAEWVVGEMERRMAVFGRSWRDATVVQAYTVHNISQALRQVIIPRGAAMPGVTLHLARPPVVGLEFEMDCRRVPFEDVFQ